jgi:phosphopantetheinyl transferase
MFYLVLNKSLPLPTITEVMPIISFQEIKPGIRRGIWHITETEEQLRKPLTLSQREMTAFSTLRTDLRKRQWLSYRNMVCSMLGTNRAHIYNTIEGKPEIDGLDIHVSISHTDQYAAVMLSDNHRVGIDIERPRDRVLRVRDKFMSERELMMIGSTDVEKHTIFWCAKEALYKVYGRKRLDFRKHISLNNLNNQEARSLRGSINSGGISRDYLLHWEKIGELIMVYVIHNR